MRVKDKTIHRPVVLLWTIAICLSLWALSAAADTTLTVEVAVFIDPDQQAYNDPIWTTTAEGLVAGDVEERRDGVY